MRGAQSWSTSRARGRPPGRSGAVPGSRTRQLPLQGPFPSVRGTSGQRRSGCPGGGGCRGLGGGGGPTPASPSHIQPAAASAWPVAASRRRTTVMRAHRPGPPVSAPRRRTRSTGRTPPAGPGRGPRPRRGPPPSGPTGGPPPPCRAGRAAADSAPSPRGRSSLLPSRSQNMALKTPISDIAKAGRPCSVTAATSSCGAATMTSWPSVRQADARGSRGTRSTSGPRRRGLHRPGCTFTGPPGPSGPTGTQ